MVFMVFPSAWMWPRSSRPRRATFTLWRVPPIMSASSLWVIGGGGGGGVPGQLQQLAGHPALHVEEDDVAELAGGPAHHLPQRTEQRVGHLRVRPEQAEELRAGDDDQPRLLDRLGGGRPGTAVERGHFPED